MKLIPLLFFFTLINGIAAQTYYPLHPAIGDTIDKLEKLDYSLFPKVDNKSYQFAMILFDNDRYQIDVIDTAGNSNRLAVSKEELIEAQQNIEKINKYYRLMASEQTKESHQKSSLVNKKYPIRLEGPMTEQMRKEARMHVRLKEDARRRNEFKQGVGTNSLYLEFK